MDMKNSTSDLSNYSPSISSIVLLLLTVCIAGSCTTEEPQCILRSYDDLIGTWQQIGEVPTFNDLDTTVYTYTFTEDKVMPDTPTGLILFESLVLGARPSSTQVAPLLQDEECRLVYTREINGVKIIRWIWEIVDYTDSHMTVNIVDAATSEYLATDLPLTRID